MESPIIAQYLEKIAILLLQINDNQLIHKQREEQRLWEERVKNCEIELQKFQQEWKDRYAIPLPRTDINGETFEQKVEYLHKTTKQFHDHLDFYAR